MKHSNTPQTQAGSNRARIAASAAGTIAVLGLLAWTIGSFFPSHEKASPAPASPAPSVRFKEVTVPAGITFKHFTGAMGEKLLPEAMGGGVAFLDYDGDGHQDLLFINGTDWPWATRKSAPSTSIELFRNLGNGAFEKAPQNMGLGVQLYGMGVAIGDYDSDGFPDIYVTALGGNRLFHNIGGKRFEDVTKSSGLEIDHTSWSTGAAWIDYDNDGDLDLFVCNYVRWSRELDKEINYALPTIGKAYGPPANFPGSQPFLFRNDGGGKFTEISLKAGLHVKNPSTGEPMGKGLAVAPVDINRDGWIDLVVANDTVQNFVFLNQRDGTFKEVGANYGIAFDSYGQTRGAMGIDTARFRNDDALGIAIGNFANEMNSLYVSQHDATLFADEALAEGLGSASRELLKFGLFFFDYDLDGRLDILTSNGHLDPSIELLPSGQKYRQPAQLFWNRGGSKGVRFEAVDPSKAVGDLFKPIVGRGSAFADLDGDGDLDVVIAQLGDTPLLLRNEQELGNNWVRFRLLGKRSNRDGIGAWISVKTRTQMLSRQVMPTRSYLSQSELPITFGLGKDDAIEEVQIVWPGNRLQKVLTAKPNQFIVIEERPE